MSDFVDALGVQVHHVTHGPAAGPGVPTAVLLHGFSPDHRLMTGCFEPVFERRQEWRRIYLDLPGMGRTVAPNWVCGTDDVFRVVQAAVAALVPTGPYVVCGESFGGYLARGLAAADPGRVEGLALVAPMVVAEHAERDVPGHRVLNRDEAFMASVGGGGEEFDEIAVVQDAVTWRRTQEEIVSGLVVADAVALDRIRQAWTGTFPLDGREPFDRPAVFVTGRQDSSTGYRDLWQVLERYPRATFAVLDRAGHNLQIEQQAVFEALAHEWLDRVDEARKAVQDGPNGR